MNSENTKKLRAELFEAGLQNRREVVGEAYVETAMRNGSSEFAYSQQELITEWAWGNIWSRPGLERRQRSLLNIGMLIALKSWAEFGTHIRGAIRNGLTELEIREAILQATVYCGAPAGVQAMKVADCVLEDMISKGEHKRQMAEVSPSYRKPE
ncbi:carboxymuconolactone decarboxylase [Colletotrichum graminicola]|uniref:Carboxymuconolactone decarboxylase n=1 Tax=Colletotrichum graminicola (strain M1.001 / M2 / FGSC 10212) TaxID=645133 RepID=E3QI60_COLGM|nr:carboxymuconolactone decarboxylase [Colletotrichum graminicola M1.001]EFQ30675.1 carboxymuconolactone decarboxylase [Colletotrichum graminicola M1.001]WDK21411.1 carboxymuconolactone decarboxylase [Colletotrichum graminicola]